MDLFVNILHETRHTNGTTLAKKFKLYRGDLGAFIWLGHDTIFVESDHHGSLHELMVRLGQPIVTIVIPVFSFAPQFLELLMKVALTVIDEEILVNGTPCAIQSACDPAVNEIGIRNVEDWQ